MCQDRLLTLLNRNQKVFFLAFRFFVKRSLCLEFHLLQLFCVCFTNFQVLGLRLVKWAWVKHNNSVQPVNTCPVMLTALHNYPALVKVSLICFCNSARPDGGSPSLCLCMLDAVAQPLIDVSDNLGHMCLQSNLENLLNPSEVICKVS